MVSEYETKQGRRGGPMLKVLLENKTPRPIDIARAGDFSRSYVCDVLNGRKPASRRFIAAARAVGLPVEVVFGKQAEESRTSP
jgi:hypothetical protein